jgi:hypothetical protein
MKMTGSRRVAVGAALLLVACAAEDPVADDMPSQTSPSELGGDGAGAAGGPGAAAAGRAGAADVAEPAETEDEPEPAPDGTPTAAPIVRVFLPALPTALDFDLRAKDIVVLRQSPSRIDACTTAGCRVAAVPNQMPREDATRTNASLAVAETSGTSSPTVLVGQKGSGKCFEDCTKDDPSLPGLYGVFPGAGAPAVPPKRIGSTLPLVFAKAFRATDGWLIGGRNAWAVARSSNNESLTCQSSGVFRQTSLATFAPSSLERGCSGPTSKPIPFVFAAATTEAGRFGYGAANGDLVDLTSGSKVGLVATSLAITANAPAAADAFALTPTTPRGSVATFDSFAPSAPQNVYFPGIVAGASLFATTQHVAFVAPPAPGAGTSPPAVALHVCSAKSLLTSTCRPTVVRLPLHTVTRVRTRGASLFVLGDVAGTPRLVKVTFPALPN